MSACGVSQQDIARCLGEKGISETTLRKHFAEELATAYMKANAQVAAKLFERIQAGELGAICFWLKCRARWQEVVRYEHSGPDSGPVQLDVIHGETDPKQILARRMAELAGRLNPGSGSGESS